MMNTHLSLLHFLVLSSAFVASCAGSTPAPVMEGRSGMLSKSAISQKCDEAAKNHLKPFVIEWDATDLASFEAKANMATVFVRYEGCSLEPVYGCSDKANPAVFGKYGQPHFTSGTVQALDVSNEGQLYAKLPLGAANLSGRIQRGESLHLEYYVSGVAMSSREEVFRGEVEKYQPCADATHFVWAYNLGAFELSSEESSSTEASASVTGIGGAEGSGAHKEASVGKGGEIESCTTQDQRACRVPIRMVLRPIADGSHPADVASPGATPAAPPTAEQIAAAQARGEDVRRQAEEQMAVFENASAAATAAREAWQAGDGVACLRYADRALSLDTRQGVALAQTRAECMMLAGQCKEGTEMYRDIIAERDAKRIRSDEDLDEAARKLANRKCPLSTAKNDPDYVIRAGVKLRALREAGNNAKECKKLFNKAVKRYKKFESKKDKDTFEKDAERAARNYSEAAYCVAEEKGCDAGFEIYWRAYHLQLPRYKEKDVKKIAAGSWDTLVNVYKKVQCE